MKQEELDVGLWRNPDMVTARDLHDWGEHHVTKRLLRKAEATFQHKARELLSSIVSDWTEIEIRSSVMHLQHMSRLIETITGERMFPYSAKEGR